MPVSLKLATIGVVSGTAVQLRWPKAASPLLLSPLTTAKQHTSLWSRRPPLNSALLSCLPSLRPLAAQLTGVTGSTPDWEDFVGIVLLLFINATLAFLEESQAGNAVAALMGALAPTARVLRDGSWLETEAAKLVVGDIIELNLGELGF